MKTKYDVIIIGGGIVGLLSAYELSKQRKYILVIDKNSIGSKKAASSGFTRSLRNDYQDPRYSRLARQAWNKWENLEHELGTKLIVKTGCLNIATNSIAENSYARDAATWLMRDGNDNKVYRDASQLSKAFPQFANIDYAVLDIEAGVGLARESLESTKAALLNSPYVDTLENRSVDEIITLSNGLLEVKISTGNFQTTKLVVTAGLGSSDIMRRINGNTVNFTLTPDKPVECLYYKPIGTTAYQSNTFPIFANLDVGIYGHPIIIGVTKAVKIGMYIPPEVVSDNAPKSISGVQEFVRTYLPELANNSTISRVMDTDQCSYDMTSDGNFVIGKLDSFPNIVIATGFCGTGFKFSPMTAEIVKDLTLDEETSYDITAFNPNRFKTDRTT